MLQTGSGQRAIRDDHDANRIVAESTGERIAANRIGAESTGKRIAANRIGAESKKKETITMQKG